MKCLQGEVRLFENLQYMYRDMLCITQQYFPHTGCMYFHCKIMQMEEFLGGQNNCHIVLIRERFTEKWKMLCNMNQLQYSYSHNGITSCNLT